MIQNLEATEEQLDKFNYIIIASGSRLERNTNNFINIDEKIYRMDNVIEHYKNRK